MINEQTWHRNPNKQTHFVWEATNNGIQIYHGNKIPPYVIPWKVFHAVLVQAQSQAQKNNRLVRVGASMTNPPADSLGAWVNGKQFKIIKGTLTSRHLSFLGPIYARIGFLNRHINGNSIEWVFKSK